MKIILLEDNENIREALRRYLELEGWQVYDFATISDLSTWLSREGRTVSLDLALLDVMLPDGDGFLVGRRLQQTSGIPLIFLTAKAEESDRITGLELGADDYIVKPFSNREVILRIKALMRRIGAAAEPQPFGGLVFVLDSHMIHLDIPRHRLISNGFAVDLTAAEWLLLCYLAERAGRVCARMSILQDCLESIAENSERTVDTHIKNIRQKLGYPAWIETVRGFGYRFSGQLQEHSGHDHRNPG